MGSVGRGTRNPVVRLPDGTEVRLCGHCETVKPLDDFYRRQSGPRASKNDRTLLGWLVAKSSYSRLEVSREA